MSLKYKGFLSIFFETEKEDILKCTITDNGTGRQKKQGQIQNLQDDRLHSGKITETRIRLFNNSKTPEKYKIVYTDLFIKEEPCGLKVEIYMPMEKG